MIQPKVLILRDQLGSKSWFTVWIDGLECSTPLDTLPEAIQWVKTMADADRVGAYRVSQDITEVIL